MQIKFDTKKVKLLSICCSFRRPEDLSDMIKTFNDTKSEGTELFIYLHEDDPLLEKYLPIVKDQSYIIEKHRMLCKAINYTIFNLFPNIPYYQTIVDDMRYRTKNWDTILVNALNTVSDFGTANPRVIDDNNWNTYQHPSAEVYSWKFVNTIGYIYPPDFDAFGADMYLRDLCKGINGLVYISSVYIEHLWWGGCNKPGDINITESYSNEKQKYGMEVYHRWRSTEMNQIIQKILDAKKIVG